MTFRRRLLVVTVTLGGGILCFQPVMRARMEARISDIIGARVDIGQSKISLIDGTIAFRDVVVHHSNSLQGMNGHRSPQPTKIEHAALKFNWNSLLYRNLEVDGGRPIPCHAATKSSIRAHSRVWISFVSFGVVLRLPAQVPG